MASIRFRHGSRGFTLLESMVALAIVALGMLAVQMQLSSFVVSAFITEEKTLASWIASNAITELSVAATWPEIGSSDDEVEFAQRDWRLTIDISETQVENLRRADVRVYLAQDPDRLVHTLSALIEPPPPPGFLPVRWFSTELGAGG